MPQFEISEIKLFDNIPNDLTYPLIQPFLHRKVLDFLEIDLNEEIKLNK